MIFNYFYHDSTATAERVRSGGNHLPAISSIALIDRPSGRENCGNKNFESVLLCILFRVRRFVSTAGSAQLSISEIDSTYRRTRFIARATIANGRNRTTRRHVGRARHSDRLGVRRVLLADSNTDVLLRAEKVFHQQIQHATLEGEPIDFQFDDRLDFLFSSVVTPARDPECFTSALPITAQTLLDTAKNTQPDTVMIE